MTGVALSVALALVVQMPEAKVIEAPATLDVVVLSKQSPRWLEIVEGACTLAEPAHAGLAGPVELISAQKGLVRTCGAAAATALTTPTRHQRAARPERPCVDLPSVVLSCGSDAVVRGASLPRRKLGPRLRARVDGRGLRVVASVPLESYVSGVVLSEIAHAPVEAQRAQAVLARSFALRAVATPRHDDAALCDLTHCQAFAGARPPIPPRVGTVNGVLVDAGGAITDVFFHSTCGGRTASPRDVWGVKSAPDVVGVGDLDPAGKAWCRRSAHFRWVHELSDRALVAALGELATRPYDAHSLVLESAVPDGTRWKLGDREGTELVDGEALHLQLSRALGFSAVKSSLFTVRRAGDQLRLSGSGLGHRVGLCQMGAIARAKAGQSSREILLAYFPKLDLANVVERSP